MSDWPKHRPITLSGSDYNGLLGGMERAERDRDLWFRKAGQMKRERDEALERAEKSNAWAEKCLERQSYLQQQLARLRAVAEERCPELRALSDWREVAGEP